MKRFKVSMLVALGLLILPMQQFASSVTNVQQVETAKSLPATQWGSVTAPAIPDVVNGVDIQGPCGATTLRFNEIPPRPVDGLNFRGAQFRFTIGGTPSFDALYNGSGPGQGVFVQDPSLEGNSAGALEISFPALTPFLSFGLARNTFSPLTPGATVLLFDMNGNLIGSFPLNLVVQPGGVFSEGQFTYDNPGIPVRTAIIIFPNPNVAQRFALDNLTYRAFDISLEDDITNDIFQFNTVTGDYQFFRCADSFTVFGRGGAVRFGCNLSFGAGGGNKGGGAQAQASVNTCSNTGTATVRLTQGGPIINVTDSNTTGNTCTCGFQDK